jgi:hypothetical protein
MSVEDRKKMTAIYIAVSLLFFVFLIGSEFFWRYDSKLDIILHAKLRDSQKKERVLIIHEQSDSPVDTSRREYKDIQHGKTNIQLWVDGGQDTISLSLQGKYISEARPVHIATDSSSQLILIPNTIQGIPSGSNSIVYFKNDMTLSLLEFSGFIADINKDGKEEVNISSTDGWKKLDSKTGQWLPVQIASEHITP